MAGEEDLGEPMRERSLSEMKAEAETTYCIGIIPCKTGSARLANKNFLEVDGRPMVVNTVVKAMSCPHIDMVCISTDNPDLLQDKAPHLCLPTFDAVRVAYRSPNVMHPETPIYNIIGDALKHLAQNNQFERAPTHVVMMQPNVPGIDQEVINELVAAVVEGPYNVARHYSVSIKDVLKGDDWIRGPMTGGCDAYKIGALTDPTMMDSYNYAVLTTDLEVHTQDDLDMAIDLMKERRRLDGPSKA
jgi:hypothetical protein